MRELFRQVVVLLVATVLLGAPETIDPVVPPAEVTGLSCTSAPGPQVECSWQGLTPAPAGYRVEWQSRETQGLAAGNRGVTETDEPSVRVHPDAVGEYDFRVFAVNRSTRRGAPVRGPASLWVRQRALPPLASTSAEPADAIEVTYGSHPRQRYYAVLPPTNVGLRPAVLVLHGGYWIRGSATGPSYTINRRLYELGYASFAVDYRYAQEAPWPAQRDDALTALAHIRAHATEYGIDPDRIGAIGNSAGGHLALWLASFGRGRDSVRAVVSYSAPTSVARVRADVRALTPPGRSPEPASAGRGSPRNPTPSDPDPGTVAAAPGTASADPEDDPVDATGGSPRAAGAPRALASVATPGPGTPSGTVTDTTTPTDTATPTDSAGSPPATPTTTGPATTSPTGPTPIPEDPESPDPGATSPATNTTTTTTQPPATLLVNPPTLTPPVLTTVERSRVRTLGKAATMLVPTEPSVCGPLCRSVAPQSEASPGDAPALLFAAEQEWVNPQHSTDYVRAYQPIQDSSVEVRVLQGNRHHALGYALSDALIWEDTLLWLRQHL